MITPNVEPAWHETCHYTVGIDPGDSTGIAVLRDIELFGVIQCHWTDALEWLDDVLAALVAHDDDVIMACERFTVTPETGRRSTQPTAARVVGAVELLGDRHGVFMTLQSPGDAKKIAPNALLRELGLYVTPQMVGRPDANDVNDGVRHAVLLVARRRPSLFDQLLRLHDRDEPRN